jgi:hypothetical protein
MLADAAFVDQLHRHRLHRHLRRVELVEEQQDRALAVLVGVKHRIALERQSDRRVPNRLAGVRNRNAAQVDTIVLTEPNVDQQSLVLLDRGIDQIGLADAGLAPEHRRLLMPEHDVIENAAHRGYRD